MEVVISIFFFLFIFLVLFCILYKNYNKVESPIIVISTFLSITVTISFIIILSKVFKIYTGVGDIDMESTGQVGDFIGGVIGTILTAISILLLYKTLQAQSKSSDDQTNQFIKSQIENRFFELLKFHRDNVNELEFTYTEHKKQPTSVKGRQFFVTVNKQLNFALEEFKLFFEHFKFSVNDIYEKNYFILVKENTIFEERKFDNFYLLAKIDICYLIVFYGVSKNGKDEILEKTEGKYVPSFISNLLDYFRLKPSPTSIYFPKWKILYDEKTLAHKMDRFLRIRDKSVKEQRDFLKGDKYYPDNYNKFYGGHQFRLGHYFRHLFQIVCFVHYNKDLNEQDKKNYIRILRGQLSDYEQKIFFYNSLSQLGRVWEISSSNGKYIEAKDHLISNYNIIKNICSSVLVDNFRPNQFYK